ncbi:DUF1636 family protein [Hansschlegelia beijingensis]|uniref:DUF1636 family protein n=1 Tax=Hansschlegelia beijingensis TaxID=1133344 RepID=UPI0037FC8C3F
MPRTVVTICRTCRPEGHPEASERPGAALGRAVRDALANVPAGSQLEVRAIACLSACSRACSAVVAAPGKFSYVVGDLEPCDAEALVAFALKHAESADGIPAWRDRPAKVRKCTIARVPPAGVEHSLIEAVHEPPSTHVDDVQERT